VSIALRVRGPQWVEQQTGVAYATLKKHYAKWMPSDDDQAEEQRLAAAFGAPEGVKLSPTRRRRGGQFPQALENSRDPNCEEGDLNPHGSYPTSPSIKFETRCSPRVTFSPAGNQRDSETGVCSVQVSFGQTGSSVGSSGSPESVSVG